MEIVNKAIAFIDSATWGFALIPFLVVLGIFFTISSGLIQFRFFRRMFHVLGKSGVADDPNKISARSALLLSIGGRVGGGNIAGVAVAISLGGPGAVFWMWMVALMGMCTALVETTLAQLYKRSDGKGHYTGGPAQAIIHGLGKSFHWLAFIYALCLIASFAIGFNAFQGNIIAGAAQDSLNIPRIASGIVITLLTGVIIFGGIKRITKVSDVLVPIMAAGYILMTIAVIAVNITKIPSLIQDIIYNAFGLREAVAGGMGAALSQGLRRGLFSNEAGLGSAPNVAATAYVKHPVSQGITQSLSVFIDTIVICSCTAFMILLGDVYQAGSNLDGVVLTQQSLVHHVGSWAQYYLTATLWMFSFSTIIYNYHLGEVALSVFTKNEWANVGLRFVVMMMVFVGASLPGAESVFAFSDPLMGLLAMVNLLSIAMLFPTAMRVINDFLIQIKKGVTRPVFHVEKFSDLDLDKDAWQIDKK